MKKNTAFLLLALVACQGKPSSNSNFFSERNVETGKEIAKIHYNGPIVLENTDQVIIPLSGDLVGSRKIYSSDGYEVGDQARYWNLMFCNRKTGDSKLLTNKKISISEIDANTAELNTNDLIDANTSGPNRNALFKHRVFYKVRDVDFNLDGYLNMADPEGLFVSAYDGTGFLRISPEGEDMKHYQLLNGLQQILISVLRDTKKDSIFNQEDELIWYKAELVGEDWKLSEMIDEAKRRELEALYLRDWVKAETP